MLNTSRMLRVITFLLLLGPTFQIEENALGVKIPPEQHLNLQQIDAKKSVPPKELVQHISKLESVNDPFSKKYKEVSAVEHIKITDNDSGGASKPENVPKGPIKITTSTGTKTKSVESLKEAKNDAEILKNGIKVKTDLKLNNSEVQRTHPSNDIQSGALLRGFYVFLGLSIISIFYFLFRSFRSVI